MRGVSNHEATASATYFQRNELNERSDQSSQPIGRASSRRVRQWRLRYAGNSIVRRVENLSLARWRRAFAAAAGLPYQCRRVLCRGRTVRLRQIPAFEDDLRAAATLDRRDFR